MRSAGASLPTAELPHALRLSSFSGQVHFSCGTPGVRIPGGNLCGLPQKHRPDRKARPSFPYVSEIYAVTNKKAIPSNIRIRSLRRYSLAGLGNDISPAVKRYSSAGLGNNIPPAVKRYSSDSRRSDISSLCSEAFFFALTSPTAYAPCAVCVRFRWI